MIRIQVTGSDLTPAQRIQLSKCMRRSITELLPGTKTTVLVTFRASAQVIPLRAMIRENAEEKLAIKNRAPLHTPLVAIGLRKTTIDRLAAFGLTTVGSLIRRTELDLLKIPGIGRRQLNEIIKALAAHGRKIGE